MKKFAALILTVLTFAFTLTGCNPSFLKESEILNIENPTGTISLGILKEDGEFAFSKSFEFILFYHDAPNTVANFISLVESGYYTDKSFERASGNDPFVIFGEQEFIEEYDDDNINLLKYKQAVEPKYHIIGEFYYNAYWDKNKDPRNNQIAKTGSMMMTREVNTENPKKTYNTAYAGFSIQTEMASKRKEYEKSFCVFGEIIGLSPSEIQSQLKDFFDDAEFSDQYDGKTVTCKFMITNVTINYPAGVAAKDFKPRKI